MADYETGSPAEDNARIKEWFDDHRFYHTGGNVQIPGGWERFVTKIKSGFTISPGTPTVVCVGSPVEIALTDRATGTRYVSAAQWAINGDVVVTKDFEPLVGDPNDTGQPRPEPEFPPYSLSLPLSAYGRSFDVEVIGVGDGPYSVAYLHSGADYAAPPAMSGNIVNEEVQSGAFVTEPTGCVLVTQQPLPQSALSCQHVVLEAVSASSTTQSYQWRKNGQVISDEGSVSGSATNSLTIDPALRVHSGVYDVVIIDDCGPVISAEATLLVTMNGDADGNDAVDFNDILSVLANFGADYTTGTGPGDADNTGIVNFNDILSVLANFGATCP